MIKALICNSDIRNIEKQNVFRNLTHNEISLLKNARLSEQSIQTNCKKYIEGLNQEFSLKKIGRVRFVHIPNGGIGSRFENHRKLQGRIGSVSGFPDSMILCYSKKTNKNKVIFVEFKRVGASTPKENQFRQQKELQEMAFKSYIINNSLFFERVICAEIRGFMGIQ